MFGIARAAAHLRSAALSLSSHEADIGCLLQHAALVLNSETVTIVLKRGGYSATTSAALQACVLCQPSESGKHMGCVVRIASGCTVANYQSWRWSDQLAA